MIRTAFLVLFLLFSCNESIQSFLWVERLPKPWTLNQQDFDFYLIKFQDNYPNYHDRLIALNLWRVGTPYGLYCLGEEQGKDKDPIIRYDSSDCTVHILTTLAFAESSSLEEAKKNMIDIHYKANVNLKKYPDYDYRWHFTSDRILNHHITVDITKSVAEYEDIENLEIELNKKDDGKNFLELDWTLKANISFIPTEKINKQIISRLPKVCGVAFIKRSYFNLGIAVAHEGFIINKTDLIHASSSKEKTVIVNFMNYLMNENKNRFDGVLFYELVEKDKI